MEISGQWSEERWDTFLSGARQEWWHTHHEYNYPHPPEVGERHKMTTKSHRITKKKHKACMDTAGSPGISES